MSKYDVKFSTVPLLVPATAVSWKRISDYEIVESPSNPPRVTWHNVSRDSSGRYILDEDKGDVLILDPSRPRDVEDDISEW